MTPSGWITLAIIAIAAFLLVTERLRPDLIALLVVLMLRLTGVLTTEQALSGFSRSAVITILSIFILTNGLERSGITHWAGRQLLRLANHSERRLMGTLILTSATLSAFMNTIAAAAILLPMTMGMARQAQIRPSRLLMPLSFGALLGGTTTLLTTANIIVSSTLSQSGLNPFHLFEFLPVGLPLVLGGALLILWLAPRILPSRDPAGEIVRMRGLRGELAQTYHLREGTCEVVVGKNSSFANLTLRQGDWGKNLGITVLGISRKNRLNLAPDPDEMIRKGDILLLDGIPTPKQMENTDLHLFFEADLISSLASQEVPLIEAVLAPRSELEGQTLREIHFRERFGLQVIALWREGLVLQQDVANTPLRFGDALLLQGPREKVRLLRLDPNFLVLEEEIDAQINLRALIATAIMVLSLTLAATQIVPIAIATLLGAALMVISGCLTMDQAYRAVEWKVIFLIAGMIPISIALENTGTANVIAEGLNHWIGGHSSLVTGVILLVLSSLLSLLLSGQTAAVIMAPIAIASASLVNTDPRALAMAVAIGCSLAFSSPLGHPANLLVMGSGGYKLGDYARLGIPLTLVSYGIAAAGLHWIWGL